MLFLPGQEMDRLEASNPANKSRYGIARIRQWYGDSRGHWEGNTLAVSKSSVNQP
jgi:hypothetical protein